jgi:hypothetical protein
VTTPRRRLSVLLASLLGMALVAGCGGGSGGGGSNGIEKLSATAALDKVKAATAKVKTVHVVGTIAQSSQTLNIDLHLGTDAAEGTIVVGGGNMDLRLVDGVTYFRGDSKVFAAFGVNPAQAGLVADKWIKDTGGSGPASSFASLLDRKQLFDSVLSPQGTIKTSGTATVAGKKAFVLVDSSSDGGKLYVADTGPALPLRIEKNGTGEGRIDFTDYDADVNVTAPSGAVDISQLVGG